MTREQAEGALAVVGMLKSRGVLTQDWADAVLAMTLHDGHTWDDTRAGATMVRDELYALLSKVTDSGEVDE